MYLKDLSIADVFALHKVAELQEKSSETLAYRATTFEAKERYKYEKEKWAVIGSKCAAELLSRVDAIYELNPKGVVNEMIEKANALHDSDRQQRGDVTYG